MIEDNSVKVECKAHDRGSTNVDFLYPLREFRPNYVTIKINSKAKRVPLQCDFHTNESWRRSGNNRRCEVKCIVHSSYDLLSTPIQAFGVSPGMASPLNSPVILYPFMSLLPLPGFFWVFFFFPHFIKPSSSSTLSFSLVHQCIATVLLPAYPFPYGKVIQSLLTSSLDVLTFLSLQYPVCILSTMSDICSRECPQGKVSHTQGLHATIYP